MAPSDWVQTFEELEPTLTVVVVVLSVIVVALSAAILWRGVIEERERKDLIQRLDVSRAALSRSDYLLMLADSVRQASGSVRFISSTFETEDDASALNRLAEAKRAVLGRVMEYRAIVPRDEWRIKGAYDLSTSGVEVLVSPRLFGDLNYTLVDRHVVILGVPAEPSGPSVSGLTAYSATLVELLEGHFQSILNDDRTETLRAFATRHIATQKENGVPPGLIEERTGIPVEIQTEWLASEK